MKTFDLQKKRENIDI